ncbi:MAG: 2-oxoglutarate dehydrogenase E1 component [Armatimonadetes bacterium CG_4_9_14_3_um_filter_66_14]|nr:MAG: 2-oxoglutarate dehydrogenase E1 component [Armatimonadetes bacterium CG_4_9_14_3_um_filter_66_14]
MPENDFLSNTLSLPFAEGLYADYLHNSQSVPPDWRRYFEALPTETPGAAEFRREPSFRPSSLFNHGGDNGGAGAGQLRVSRVALMQDRVDQLIRAYRVRGHLVAKLDPLGRPRPEQVELDHKFYGFTDEDLGRPFSVRTIHGHDVLPLREILNHLRNTYCRSIGVQFMHIDSLPVKEWLQDRMEGTENRLELTPEEQLRILTRLTDAVIFEDFLHKKYVGAKSFSLEGAESLIPLLDLAIEKASELGVERIVIGMPHRGRLNVLANILGKSPREIFREFEDSDPELHVGGGDVKYHLGYHSDWITAAGKKVHLSLTFNPSHLEFVNPVALGRMRARQDRDNDHNHEHSVVLLMHGDAAFAGEGVVQESLNLSQLAGYTTGGTIHVVVNNQLGFTTSPEEGRSTTYATDVAKMLQIPIFHMNGEDPEAVAQVIKLALEFRKTYQRDVVIDMYCYRRYGHNESDEPAFTQPVMYRAIAARKSVRDGYLEHLRTDAVRLRTDAVRLRTDAVRPRTDAARPQALNGMPADAAEAIAVRRRELLEQALSEARTDSPPPLSPLGGLWATYQGGLEKGVPEVDTTVDTGRLRALLLAQARVPPEFRPHHNIRRLLQQRAEMANGGRALDWLTAEALAFASLATEGVRVRLTGQDSARGTFTHRHAVLHDLEDGHAYTPLCHLSDDQAPVSIYNSPLSETGVLGFEYGYSLDCPEGLTLWEAQFGDFCNAAQVIVDQFVASGEDKWQRLSGLVLLLPHGFEGQGAEHSSARLERFLLLAAEDNLQIVNLTTPAQYFHCLRRQVLRPWRKPLVVMTPKSLLRHAQATSTLDELATGGFRRILPDALEHKRLPSRVLLCCGKLYYELDERRQELSRDDVALLRFEQLYPLSEQLVAEALAPYPEGTPVFWVQEEPENMGAWPYMRKRFGDRILGRLPLQVISRPESASPATGSHSSHKLEQDRVVRQAFGEGGP